MGLKYNQFKNLQEGLKVYFIMTLSPSCRWKALPCIIVKVLGTGALDL